LFLQTHNLFAQQDTTIKLGGVLLRSNMVFSVMENVTGEKFCYGSEKDLQYVVDRMIQNPKLRIVVACHTDSRGNDKYNLKLSQRRAEILVRYLNQKNKLH
jgi:hypothetical protein